MTAKKTHTKQDVLDNATQYFKGDSFAAGIWTDKYALRNEKHEFLELAPDDMHRRMAREYARVESKYPNPMSEEQILELISGFKYVIPGGSVMFGIGNPFQLVSLGNCFVISVVDSYGGICRADERIAQISKRRGGCGLDISPLRPKGMPTKNAALTTDGIVVFMEQFSGTCRRVAQSGRRGALMLSISVHHPEIMNFIKSKAELNRVTGANISVRVTDEFMKAVKADKEYELRWPVDSDKPSMSAKVRAKDVWDELIAHAFAHAEPGLLFWDNITENSPADCYGKDWQTISTNPCGELPLPPGGSCLLTSLNLSSYVVAPFTPEAKFDEEKFASHVGMAQRMLDDLVDLEMEHIDAIIKKIENDPEDEATKSNEKMMWKEIRGRCEMGRRTGLGITALGDCIAMLNSKYGDEKSYDIVKKVYSTLRNEAYRMSVQMAKERGKFQIFDHKKEKDHPYLSKLPKDILEEMIKHGRRNIACLTTTPVGTASNVAASMGLFGTTSGFEPVFLNQYTRKRKMADSDESEPDFVDEMGDRWKYFDIFHPGVQNFIAVTGKTFEDSPYNGAQSSEIDFMKRVELQAMATKYVDHSVSSTVNLPNDISEETVGKIYMTAWESGCKGLTVYRQGSRDGVLVEKGKGSKTKKFEPTRECDNCDEVNDKFRQLLDKGQRPSRIMVSSAPKRPETLECDIIRAKVGKDEWVFIIGKLHGRPYEVFGGDSGDLTLPKKYKSGWTVKDGKLADRSLYDLVVGDLKDENEKMVVRNIAKVFNNYQHAPFSRLLSLGLRHGNPIRYICEQITKDPEDDFFSFNKAMARVLKRYVADGESSGMDCPDCHNQMVYKGGCPTCMVCGKSTCA